MGHYAFTTVQVADLTGLSVRQLDYWAQQGLFLPSVQQSHGPGTRKLYSVEDVIQLRSLQQLKCYRWSTQKVREAINTLRDVMKDDNPLRQAMLIGSGNKLIAVCKTKQGERFLLDALRPGGQGVLGVVLETLEEETRRVLTRFNEQR